LIAQHRKTRAVRQLAVVFAQSFLRDESLLKTGRNDDCEGVLARALPRCRDRDSRVVLARRE
jgi:hypothetical protein